MYIWNVRIHRSGSITLSVIYPPYIAGPIQRLGHATLASDIGRIRSVVPGTSGISEDDNDNDNDNDGTLVKRRKASISDHNVWFCRLMTFAKFCHAAAIGPRQRDGEHQQEGHWTV